MNTETKGQAKDLQIDLHLSVRRMLDEADKLRRIQDRLIAIAQEELREGKEATSATR